ncbi:MAG TPA: TetR/AcrR family transcriptional regulator [Amycolatopsis sp.]|nr:TetR/AcrR family transcriptional regulator [Amycolatopsis sp.]
MGAAARLYKERGYHNVSMDDVAATVGLTGPALYRHFHNKHDILAQALTDQLKAVEEVGRAALEVENPAGRLELFLSDLGDLVLGQEEALLWKRERRHLTGDEQVEFRAQLRVVLDLAVAALGLGTDAGSRPESGLLTWSVLSVYSNTRYYRAKLDEARTKRILAAAAASILHCDLRPARPGVAADLVPHRPVGRRERILATATRLFDRDGFYAVGIEEIAAESDTAIATFYQNFLGKTELLHAVLARGAEGLQYVTRHRLGTAETPHDVLDVLVRTYIELALGPHRPLLGILYADLIYLPDAEQQAIRGSEREYVAEWVAAIQGVRPGLDVQGARALAHSAIGIVNDIVPIANMRARPRIADELRLILMAVLGTEPVT